VADIDSRDACLEVIGYAGAFEGIDDRIDLNFGGGDTDIWHGSPFTDKKMVA
jgi:hypothetical protein